MVRVAGEVGALMLAKAIKRQGQLFHLEYARPWPRTERQVALTCSPLHSLAKNYVGKAGAFAIAKLLRTSTCLRFIECVAKAGSVRRVRSHPLVRAACRTTR